MQRSIRQTIIYLLVALVAAGLVFIAPNIAPAHVNMTWFDWWTSMFVLGVSEYAPIHSGKARYRFRMAAQIPLILLFGLFPVLVLQIIFIALYEIVCYAYTRRVMLYSPRVLSAIVVPSAAAAVYGLLHNGQHVGPMPALIVTVAIYYLMVLAFHYIPGQRHVVHPWQPIRGWLGVLLFMDALLAFGAVAEDMSMGTWSILATTLQIVVVIGSIALYTDSSIRRSRLIPV